MKIVCDACQAKYFVADEKVQKAVVRLTCQKCGHAIVIRRDQAQEQADAEELRGRLAAATSPRPEEGKSEKGWYFSRDGQSFGPFPKGELVARFANGELGHECYVWAKSLGAWMPAHSVSPFDEQMCAGQASAEATRNPMQDLPHEVEQIEQTNVRPSPRVQGLRETLDELEDATASGAAGAHDAGAVGDAHDALDSDSGDDSGDDSDDDDGIDIAEFVDIDSDPSGPVDRGALARARQEPRVPALDPLDLDELDSMDEAIDLDADLVSMDHSVVDLEADLVSMDQRVVDLDTDPNVVGSSGKKRARGGSQPPRLDRAGDTSKMDDDWLEGDLPSTPADLFAADAAMRAQDQAPIEKSMMIHISHLRQQNRKVRVYAVLVAAALALLGVVLLAFEWYTDRDLEGEARWVPSAALKGGGGALVDDAEFERMAPIDDFSIVDWDDTSDSELLAMAEGMADADSGETAGTRGDRDTSRSRGRSETHTNDTVAAHDSHTAAPPDSDPTSHGRRGSGDDAQTPSAVADAAAKAAEKRRRSRSADKPVASGDLQPTAVDDVKPVFAVKMPGANAVKVGSFGQQRKASAAVDIEDGAFSAPTNTRGSKYAKGTGRKVKSSERSQFRAGLKTVSKSVQECHKRQLKTGSLGIAKVYLSITVEPDGTVSRAKFDGGVKDSVFEKCMLSKLDRWSFEAFEGKPVDLRQGFVLE